MNLSTDTARGYEVIGTQKEGKALMVGTQLHAVGEVATTCEVCCALYRLEGLL